MELEDFDYGAWPSLGQIGHGLSGLGHKVSDMYQIPNKLHETW